MFASCCIMKPKICCHPACFVTMEMRQRDRAEESHPSVLTSERRA